MKWKLIHPELRDGIATVVMDHPPANAMNTQLFAELTDYFRERQEDGEVRAVVLTATGQRFFSAGLDVKEFEALPPDAPVGELNRQARRCFAALIDCPVPVIGALNGMALGGGLALAGCCDVLIASQTATLGLPEIKVGLLGAATFLYRLFPPMKVRKIFYTGEMVSAQEAYRLGAVEKVVPPEQLLAEAMALAREFAARSPVAIRLAKESCLTIETIDLKRSYRTEQGFTAELYGYRDSREARRAFLEKRPPVFTGE